ncbi:MAG: DUF87 domain-containing protein [Nanoarchaeota archaeon]|nr:DUF87 domain-containing protein [Nanoarchaeota archaeon]
MEQKALTVEEICNKLRPVLGKRVDEIYFQYTVAETKEEREEIVHILNALFQKNLNQLLDKGVLLEPPRKELIDGEYELATISYAKRKLFPFKLREQDWPRHICVTGMSGSGKTTFAFKVIEALNKQNKPYLIFDWKKSFRPLSATDNQIMTFTVGEEKVSNLFKTNINQPPKGVAAKEWINVLSDLLTEAFSASFGVHKVILETLDEAFKEWGIYNGSQNYPTWNHIKWRLEEKLNKIQGREAGWIESALRVATVMTFGEFGKVVNYKGENSFTVEELLDKKVVMELNSLGSIEKTFFCEFLLTYIFKLKKSKQNLMGNGFDHAIIVDEAHNIFLKKPTNFTNESTTDMIYREMREYGTSLICLDQHISKISDTVKGNSACHIAFQQQLPQDIQDISEIMQLVESRHYFSQLPVGNAIVKLAERFPTPFLIEVPYVDLRNKTVTDDNIKARMQAMIMNKNYKEKTDPEFNKAIEEPKTIEKTNDQRPTTNDRPKPQTEEINKTEILCQYITAHLEAGIPLEQIEDTLEKSKTQGNYTSTDIMTAINKVLETQLDKPKKIKTPTSEATHKRSDPQAKRPTSEATQNLSSDEDKFLSFLKKNPKHVLSTTAVYKQIGLSARKGTNAKNALEQKGLIKIKEIKYDKGWKKIIRLPDQE